MRQSMFAVLIIFITSCDPSEDTYYYLTNNSQQNICLVLYKTEIDEITSDTFNIVKGERHHLYSDLRTLGGAGLAPMIGHDSVVVYNSGLDFVLIKWIQPDNSEGYLTSYDTSRMEISDFYYENDWQRKESSKHVVKEIFTITQDDIDNYKE